jgi:hypothetical protein
MPMSCFVLQEIARRDRKSESPLRAPWSYLEDPYLLDSSA